MQVRLPGLTAPNPNAETPNAKYGYLDKLVSFSNSKCTINNNKYQQYNSQCDDFINVYCTNIHNEYKNLAGNNYNPFEFANYKPECACYVDPNLVPGVLNIPGIKDQPQTWFSPCAGKTAYWPSSIRNSDNSLSKPSFNVQQCITESNINAANIQGGIHVCG